MLTEFFKSFSELILSGLKNELRRVIKSQRSRLSHIGDIFHEAYHKCRIPFSRFLVFGKSFGKTVLGKKNPFSRQNNKKVCWEAQYRTYNQKKLLRLKSTARAWEFGVAQYSLSSSCSTLFSISEVLFWRLKSLAFTWHFGNCDAQSAWALTLHILHRRPCRVCPARVRRREVCGWNERLEN